MYEYSENFRQKRKQLYLPVNKQLLTVSLKRDKSDQPYSLTSREFLCRGSFNPSHSDVERRVNQNIMTTVKLRSKNNK